MRSLINVKTKSNEKITSLNINNQIETNPKTIDAFNKFFSTIANDIDNKIVPTNKTQRLFEWLNSKFIFSNLCKS